MARTEITRSSVPPPRSMKVACSSRPSGRPTQRVEPWLRQTVPRVVDDQQRLLEKHRLGLTLPHAMPLDARAGIAYPREPDGQAEIDHLRLLPADARPTGLSAITPTLLSNLLPSLRSGLCLRAAPVPPSPPRHEDRYQPVATAAHEDRIIIRFMLSCARTWTTGRSPCLSPARTHLPRSRPPAPTAPSPPRARPDPRADYSNRRTCKIDLWLAR